MSNKNKNKREKARNSSQNKPQIVSGILSLNMRGIGYLRVNDTKIKISTDRNTDIEIQNSDLQTALNGDTVLVMILPKFKQKGQRISGRVIEIKKRAKKVFVGTLMKERNKIILKPDDKKVYTDIIISESYLKQAEGKIGSKALVQIIKWEKNSVSPEGNIIKIIGPAGEHNTEMKAILYEKGFEIDFPDTVEAEAKKLEQTEKPIPESEIVKRTDFRETITFTIDPKDAKDFDDAISIKSLHNGNFEIGVHIADVSHYVREKSSLDAEAMKREFSVYLVDRTIPMLPEVLSNDICSLNPNEEKLTFSAVFEMSAQGKILSRWFGKTIIKSNKRFTYETAQEILNSKQGEFYLELKTLDNLAKKLRRDKVAHGAIDFGQNEIAFELDHQGKPIKIYKKERLDTHKLVEEYMLLANKEVAEYIYKAYKKMNSDSPFIYRIHDLPDQEKINTLSIFVKALGYELLIEKQKGVRGIDLQNLFQQIEGKAEEAIIKTAAIRSMTKAIYSTKNIGHFGLAFEFYTHFTSPIRRYPDLLVHRLLEKHLKNERLPKTEWIKYEKISADATEKEIQAAEAERDSKKYKQIEFMTDKIGQSFTGIITGVTDWGLYIEEKETLAEGMIKIRDLGDDYYILDQKNYCLIGQKTKKKYSLGDQIQFKIIGANLERKSLDYKLAN